MHATSLKIPPRKVTGGDKNTTSGGVLAPPPPPPPPSPSQQPTRAGVLDAHLSSSISLQPSLPPPPPSPPRVQYPTQAAAVPVAVGIESATQSPSNPFGDNPFMPAPVSPSMWATDSLFMSAPGGQADDDEALANFVAVLLRFGQPPGAQGASAEQMARLDGAWRAAAPSDLHIGQALAQCAVAMHDHERPRSRSAELPATSYERRAAARQRRPTFWIS